ncbi:MAG: hypothetical protein M1826_002479 [Phylliscum demangeonii]|nr:MAG: hypothetical protein M1826_002479 [Phylliscum demangeonii]
MSEANISPRRLLVLGRANSGTVQLVQDLTGSRPNPTPASLLADAGDAAPAPATHTWSLTTAYYQCTIQVWMDEVPSSSSSSSTEEEDDEAEWQAGYLRTGDGQEVLGVLGAVVCCFRRPTSAADLAGVRRCLQTVAALVVGRKKPREDGDDDPDDHDHDHDRPVFLAVSMPPHPPPLATATATATAADDDRSPPPLTPPPPPMTADDWDELLWRDGLHGVEYIDGELPGAGAGRNEYGEETGLARLRQVLETVEWMTPREARRGSRPGREAEGEAGGLLRELLVPLVGHGEEEGEEDEDRLDALSSGDRRDRLAAGNEDEDEDDDEGLQVEQLEALMAQVQAVREMSKDLPERERRRVAARAVRRMMGRV